MDLSPLASCSQLRELLIFTRDGWKGDVSPLRALANLTIRNRKKLYDLH
jgi:hypothetical protein